jgi:hypothetical protein
MKIICKTLIAAGLLSLALASCKKSESKPTAAGTSVIEGFWTYKEDTNIDYWNENVLFKSDGTFRMYAALSLADTSAAQAIADTANQVITFGTYTVKGNDVEMTWQELSVVGFTFSGSLNGGKNILIGNIETKEPGSASPLWYLTKP